MSRSVVASLIGTCLLLIIATAWVPVRIDTTRGFKPSTLQYEYDHQHDRAWIWELPWDSDGEPPDPKDGPVLIGFARWGVRWWMYALQLILVVAAGGLLTIFLRTWAARRAES